MTSEQTTAPCGGAPPYAETGPWSSSSLKGFDGSGTRYSTTAGASATWRSAVPSGRYEVAVWFPAHTGSTTTATYTVGGDDVVVDQRAGGGAWHVLGEWDFDRTAAVTLTVSGRGYHRADAVRFTAITP